MLEVRRSPALHRLTFAVALALGGIGAAACFAAAADPPAPSPPGFTAREIGPGVVRFLPDPEPPSGVPPFPAFPAPPAPGAAVARLPREVPAPRSLHGRVAVEVAVPTGTSLYGTGEVAGPLLRNGRRTVGWNFDAFGYGDDTPHLYQAHPWVLAVRPDGSAFGVLFETTYRFSMDLTAGILFAAEGPPFAVTHIEGAGPAEVVAALAGLTGRMPLPPLWALGYHQCRWSYFPEARVREVADAFRARDLPCDVIWLDIDYMDGFRCFTFDPRRFDRPDLLNAYLHERGFRSVWMIDPGIKHEPGWFVHDGGSAIDGWVKAAGGAPYVGRVWPGDCVFPDFLNGGVRAWWAGLYANFLATGLDGVWNDMNEPSVFDGPGGTMPADNRHAADAELGGPGDHARYHNLYGMQMVRASREGILAARPDRRPFVLSRANFLGGQRYAATWTGDNTADWYHLDASIPMILNLGLSGQPFSGPDIGGFHGNGDGAMFARWMGIGALLPFARGHAHKDMIDKEPWAFGPDVEATCRRALGRRYRLLPYLYTLFREASVTGLPVARPLFFADPADPALRGEDEAFLLGGDLLVAARTNPENRDSWPAPPGVWRSFTCGVDDAADPNLPELRLRGGAILPLGPVMEHTGERPWEPLELVVCLDEGGTAEGTLYEDAGDGFGYDAGEYRLLRFIATASAGGVRVSASSIEGAWPLGDRAVEVRVLAERGELRGVGRLSTTIVVSAR